MFILEFVFIIINKISIDPENLIIVNPLGGEARISK